MKKYLVLGVVMLLLGGISFAQSSTKKEKKQWAQYDRYAMQNQSLKDLPNVVFMGNSITDNWAKLVPEFFVENNYAGRGISGQTTEQMLARFRQDVVDLHPKIVVILAGINDIAQNNGPISNENILNNIKSMCDIATANNIVPVLCSILPCDYFVWRKTIKPASIVIELNKMIKGYADEMNYQYVDYHSVLSTISGALDSKYTKDHCHPTKEGYSVMVDVVQKVLKPMLSDSN